VAYAQRFAANLAGAVQGRSLRQVAREADISHSTLLAVMAGARWPDMITIAKLEDSLAIDLWPRRTR
jgi:lambda repressor-like predicted transcriptional regulator